MSYQSERDEFLHRMGKEGIRAEVAAALLRAATTLNRIAELECSSEAADRDRVPCPAARKVRPGPCLCADYGSQDRGRDARCRRCGQTWRERVSYVEGPSISGEAVLICPKCSSRGCEAGPVTEEHGDVPRIAVREHQVRARVERLCEGTGLVPVFSGDPRGCVLKVKVPSGDYNTWGGAECGIGVPSGPSGLKW